MNRTLWVVAALLVLIVGGFSAVLCVFVPVGWPVKVVEVPGFVACGCYAFWLIWSERR